MSMFPVYVDEELEARMAKVDHINWSRVARKAFTEICEQREAKARAEKARDEQNRLRRKSAAESLWVKMPA